MGQVVGSSASSGALGTSLLLPHWGCAGPAQARCTPESPCGHPCPKRWPQGTGTGWRGGHGPQGWGQPRACSAAWAPLCPCSPAPPSPRLPSPRTPVPCTPAPPCPCTPCSVPQCPSTPCPVPLHPRPSVSLHPRARPPHSPVPPQRTPSHRPRPRPAHSAETTPITRITRPLATPTAGQDHAPFGALRQSEARTRAAPPTGARPPCTVSMERGASRRAHAPWRGEVAAPGGAAQAAGSETPWGNPRWGESGAGPVQR